jgi:putative SOS response-associated peptidase YedK
MITLFYHFTSNMRNIEWILEYFSKIGRILKGKEVIPMYKQISLSTDLAELKDQFQIKHVLFNYQPQTSVEPNQHGSVIVSDGDERSLVQYTWGIFPHWAKDAINARSETIHEKEAYRKMFVRNRCVIPCDFFFAAKAEKKKTRSIRFALREQRIFGLAGLYDVWRNPRGSEFRTFTLLTTRANRLISDYHESMPVILDDYSLNKWLDPTIHNKEMLASLLHSFDPQLMTAELLPYEDPRRKKQLAGPADDIQLQYALIKK